MKNKPTQEQRIIKYISDFGSITQYEALTDLGIMRLASRMNGLKQKGWDFKREMISVANRYGEKCRVARYSELIPPCAA